MQPYQKANEETFRAMERGPKYLASAGSSAVSAALLGQVGSFLSQYIPQNLAIKGLSKLDPRFGKYINQALEEGFEWDEIKNVIGEKVESGLKTEQPKGTQNIIEQSSPELHQYIVGELNKGRTPTQVAAMTKNIGQFKKVITELRRQHNIDWFDLIEELYGQGKAQGTPMQQKSGVGAALSQQTQGPSEAMQRLTSLLQRGSQILNG